ncbi:DUF1636 domain-containing protein [Polaromonas sp. P1(28)-13]|nr:DUF1636 domain-containing protein [Polaromonas sp. P1(28)-13]
MSAPPAAHRGASRELPAEGLALFEAVQEALLVCELDTGQHKGLQVRGLACMSGCSRACTVTLQARGKFSYYFGDLVPDAETAAQVIACAQLHRQSADGNLALQYTARAPAQRYPCAIAPHRPGLDMSGQIH